MYGDVIRRFNSTENIASQMIECAMFGFDLFSEPDIIAGVTEEKVIQCLKKLYEEKSVLSVILPKN